MLTPYKSKFTENFDDEDFDGEEEVVPDTHDDIFVHSAAERSLGDTLVAYLGLPDRKLVGDARKEDAKYLDEQIKAFQEKEGYFGNVWRVDNRGRVADLWFPEFY